MVKRDEMVAPAAPALPQKPPLPSANNLDADIEDVFGTDEKQDLRGLPELGGGGGGRGGGRGLPPVGRGGGRGGGGDPAGLPPLGGAGGGKSGGFLNDWEDPPPYSP